MASRMQPADPLCVGEVPGQPLLAGRRRRFCWARLLCLLRRHVFPGAASLGCARQGSQPGGAGGPCRVRPLPARASSQYGI